MKTRKSYRIGLALLALGAGGGWGRPAVGQTGPELVLEPFAEGTKIELNTSTLVAAQANTTAPGRPVAVVLNDTDWRVLLPVEGWAHPVVGYEQTWIHLDTTHPGLPRNLLDQSVGAGATLYATDTWKFLATVAAGYAADDPYAGAAGLYAKASLVAAYQIDEKSALQISLNYNGNCTLFPDVPIPAVAYTRQESKTLRYTLGLPYSAVHWEPVERLTVDVNYYLPITGDATVGYNLTEQWQVFGAFASRMDAFFQDDQNTRRIFFEQDTVEAGVKWSPCRNVQLTLAGGYAFKQRFSSGFDARNLEEISKITDEPYVRVGLAVAF